MGSQQWGKAEFWLSVGASRRFSVALVVAGVPVKGSRPSLGSKRCCTPIPLGSESSENAEPLAPPGPPPPPERAFSGSAAPRADPVQLVGLRDRCGWLRGPWPPGFSVCQKSSPSQANGPTPPGWQQPTSSLYQGLYQPLLWGRVRRRWHWRSSWLQKTACPIQAPLFDDPNYGFKLRPIFEDDTMEVPVPAG